MTPLACETRMFAESAQAAAVVGAQSAANHAVYDRLADRLHALDPSVAFTCARGSSDHAATFAKFLFETRLGIPTVSAIAVGRVAVSQSDQSCPRYAVLRDLAVGPQSRPARFGAGGARRGRAGDRAGQRRRDSPLADIAEVVVPLHAGPETSVAATKTYIASLAAIAALVAAWTDDAELRAAVAHLPDSSRTAWDADWTPRVEPARERRKPVRARPRLRRSASRRKRR